MLLDGTGPQQMLDNITVDGDGNLILREDPGNSARPDSTLLSVIQCFRAVC
jgi:hypothetical protein